MIIFASLLLLALIWATWRRWATHRLLWLMGGGAALYGIVFIVNTQRQITLHSTDAAAFHDTYYVVAQGAWMIAAAVVPLVLGLLHWAQNRWATPLWPRVQALLVWLFGVALVLPSVYVATFAPAPERYVDYAAAFATVNRINLVSTMVVWATLLALTLLPVFALIFRRTAS